MSLVITSAGTAGTVTGPDNAPPVRGRTSQVASSQVASSQVATSTDDNSPQPTVQPAVVTSAVTRPAPNPSPNLTNAQASSTSLPPPPLPVVQNANPNPPTTTSSSRNNPPVTNRPIPSPITSTSSTRPSESSAPPQDFKSIVVFTTTSGSTVVTITTTSALNASAIQTGTANRKPQSLLENRPAMVGVFSSVGALLLLAVVGFCVLAVRRRKRKRLEMEAIDFTPTAVHLLATADTGKDEAERGSVGGRTRKSDTSFYSQGSVGAGSALASNPPSEMQMVQQQPVMSNFAGMGAGAGYYDDREGFSRPYYDPMRQQQQQQQQQQQEWSLPDPPPAARHPPQLRPTYDVSRVVPTGYRRPGDAPTQTSNLPPFAASGSTLSRGPSSRTVDNRGEREYAQPFVPLPTLTEAPPVEIPASMIPGVRPVRTDWDRAIGSPVESIADGSRFRVLKVVNE